MTTETEEKNETKARAGRLGAAKRWDWSTPKGPPDPSSSGRQPLRDVTGPPDWLRLAAEFKWENPFSTWQEVADHVGKSRVHFSRVRQTEAWEIAMREAGVEHATELAPAAMRALLDAWKKGNPIGAIDVLRSFAFLLNERTEVTISGDLKGELDRLEKELGLPV